MISALLATGLVPVVGTFVKLPAMNGDLFGRAE